MHSRSIQLQSYERDRAGNAILDPVTGRPIPTWVLPVGKHFAKAEEVLSNDQELWREVAALVCLDALGLSRPTRKARPKNRNLSKDDKTAEHIKVILEAQNFLTYEAEHARVIFHVAGLNADDLLTDVQKAYTSRDILNG